MTMTEGSARELRAPLMLIGGFFGLLQGGLAGGAMGFAAGYVVGTFVTSLGTGVLILLAGFGLLWLQAMRAGPDADGDPSLLVRGEIGNVPWLPATVDLRGESTVCVTNATDRALVFEHRWGNDGAWQRSALAAGSRGFAAHPGGGRFEVRWTTRPGRDGSSTSTRWTRGQTARGSLAGEACDRVQRMDFLIENERLYLVDPDNGPRALVCVVNRTDRTLRFEYAWGEAGLSAAEVGPGRNRWFESGTDVPFRMRYEAVPGDPSTGVERALETRAAEEPFYCGKAARHVFSESEGGLALRYEEATR